MYLFEWLFYKGAASGFSDAAPKKVKKKRGQRAEPPPPFPKNVQESVSDRICDNESLYGYNDSYIDVRTAYDEKRGGLTLAIAVPIVFFIYVLLENFWFVFSEISRGNRDLEFFICMVIVLPTFYLGVLYICFRYVFRYLQLEAFTARRLVVRFNRKTRKVYLLRPERIGGIRIMDWDKVEIGVPKDLPELAGVGAFVILGWEEDGGADMQGNSAGPQLVFLGKPARGASELLAFWEYIRRYMEDGPTAAPPPKKLICKFPWPWLSFKAAWRLDSRFLRHPVLWVFVVLNALILPVILLHALFHWLSLLLCYEPRFPREIEQAAAGRVPAQGGRS